MRIDQQRYGCEVLQRIVRQRFIEAGIDHHRGARQINRVAIGQRFGDEFGADVATRTGPVVDHHLLAPRFGEFLSDQTRDQIHTTTGGEGNDEADGACRVRLRLRLRLDGGNRGESSHATCNAVKVSIHRDITSAQICTLSEERAQYWVKGGY